MVKIEGKSSSWQEEEKVEGLHLRLSKRRKEAQKQDEERAAAQSHCGKSRRKKNSRKQKRRKLQKITPFSAAKF